MRKWLFGLLAVVAIGYFGKGLYELHQAGYMSMPELNDGEYPISFRNGLRAIVINPDVTIPHDLDDLPSLRRLTSANPDRKYLGVPYEVPSWFESAWSYCEQPSEGEQNAIVNSMPEEMRRNFSGARLDAVCAFEADGNKIPRGLLFSVPRL